MELERFKTYARIDHADEDVLIESMLTAADNAVRDMTGKDPPKAGLMKSIPPMNELFDMAVLQLAAHWYENRTPVTDAAVNEVPFTLQVLLNHIALSSRYPEKEAADEPDE